MGRLSDILLSPKKAQRHPIEIAIVGFFYASLSLLLSIWIFPESASTSMVFLTVIACLYLVQGMVIREESLDQKTDSEKGRLHNHAKVLEILGSLFLGFLLAFFVWTLILPQATLSATFSIQEATFENIKSITGRAIAPDALPVIFNNNIRVLFLSLLFALFYGAGAIFILAWNASLMGYVMGTLVRHVTGYTALPRVFMKYLLHGIPEIMAYFAAALAGSILFIAVIRSDISIKSKLRTTLKDVSILLIISIALLAIAAVLETFVSPLV